MTETRTEYSTNQLDDILRKVARIDKQIEELQQLRLETLRQDEEYAYYLDAQSSEGEPVDLRTFRRLLDELIALNGQYDGIDPMSDQFSQVYRRTMPRIAELEKALLA